MNEATADLTEFDLQSVIMRDRHRRAFCMPNYTPSRWWECDVFEVTQAGYFREYEVKLTISDFKADAKKARTSNRFDDRGRYIGPADGRTKHALLSEGCELGPSEFWFVTPPGLVATSERPKLDPLAVLPKWAGLIEVERRGGYLRERVARRAPRLHRQKVRPVVSDHARGVAYWRLHALLWDTAVERRRKNARA